MHYSMWKKLAVGHRFSIRWTSEHV